MKRIGESVFSKWWMGEDRGMSKEEAGEVRSAGSGNGNGKRRK